MALQAPARTITALKLMLEEQGRRQDWLARQLGVNPRQVWAWVHGLHLPEEDTRERIAKILERDVNEVFPDSDTDGDCTAPSRPRGKKATA